MKKSTPNIEHIITGNKDRFPIHLQQADDSEMRRQRLLLMW